MGRAAKPDVCGAPGLQRPSGVLAPEENRWTGKGPQPMWRATLAARGLVVADASGNVLATMREAQLTLADGETLTWVSPRISSRLCGLGGDLGWRRACGHAGEAFERSCAERCSLARTGRCSRALPRS